MPDQPEQPRFSPSRALILNIMLSLLVASAVFVVVASMFLVPQMARQEAELRMLRHELTELRTALEETPAAAEAQRAPAAPADQQASAPAQPAGAGAETISAQGAPAKLAVPAKATGK